MCTRVYAYMYVCRCVCLGVFTCLFYVRMRVSVCVYVHTCPGIMYRGGQGQTLNFNWTFLKILFAPQVLTSGSLTDPVLPPFYNCHFILH